MLRLVQTYSYPRKATRQRLTLAIFFILVFIFLWIFSNYQITTKNFIKNEKLETLFKKRRQFVEQFCQSKGYSDQDLPVKEDNEPSRLFLLEKIRAMFCMFVFPFSLFFFLKVFQQNSYFLEFQRLVYHRPGRR